MRKTFLNLITSALVLVSAGATDESALAISYNDDLKWGPCPTFIGEGCQIAVLHGDPAKENLDIFFKVPADYPIPHHWHTSAERMILVSGKLTVTYDNQESEVLTKGMYAYGPSKLPHTAYCEKGDEPCVIFIAFEEPIDAFEVVKETP
ncbi:cupin domain-containing protein [Sulfurovum sp. zt1-1]|uniref:Cupin domain-containing protein n=1 Tax=Sulfurovum zhangzhouensis TaxID=3019067 RepID=A0ABT7QUQ7_9BACT|nr:cupin domain-containing protein [Sulfurovum zhangzhouensis]MDM5270563.1 cupin domain-containing protein [Sulfurovum zhangzhouensis]